MPLRVTTRWGRGPVYEGEINGLHVLVLATDVVSSKGLGRGKVEQMYVGRDCLFMGEDRLLSYRREWISPPPQDRTLREVVEQTVRQIDGKSVDWEAERHSYERGMRGP